MVVFPYQRQGKSLPVLERRRLQRTINLLLQGPSLNKVRLKALAAQTKVDSTGGETKEETHWSFFPSISERVEAFLSRGKLAAKEDEKPQAPAQDEKLA